MCCYSDRIDRRRHNMRTTIFGAVVFDEADRGPPPSSRVSPSKFPPRRLRFAGGRQPRELGSTRDWQPLIGRRPRGVVPAARVTAPTGVIPVLVTGTHRAGSSVHCSVPKICSRARAGSYRCGTPLERPELAEKWVPVTSTGMTERGGVGRSRRRRDLSGLGLCSLGSAARLVGLVLDSWLRRFAI